MSRQPNTEEMRLIVESAAQALLAEWALDIKDPLSVWIDRAVAGDPAPDTRRWAARIEDYIRTAGKVWGRILDQRTGPPFYRTSDAWCGFFVDFGYATAHRQPNAPQFKINPKISEIVLPSTLRIDSRAHWLRAGYLVPLNGKAIKPADIQRGDIVTIQTRRVDAKDYGDHYVFALSGVDEDGFFDTVEGNAEGRKPTGPDTRQGVVKCRRPISRVRRVYRLEPRHFIYMGN